MDTKMNYMLKIIGGVENNFPFLHTHTKKIGLKGNVTEHPFCHG